MTELADRAGEGWVKADLHLHTSEDPHDAVEYSASELVERASAMGYGALAITLHSAVFDGSAVFERAAELGLLLIRGCELRLDGADVVALNISPAEAEAMRTLDDLRVWRQERGNEVFVLLPHPFYVIGGSMGGRKARKYADCFDAVEYCHFHSGPVGRNGPAVAFARERGLPLLATSDAHRWKAFGRHYTWIEAGDAPTTAKLFAAIREGKVRRVSPPCSLFDFADILWDITIGHPLRRFRKRNRIAVEPVRDVH